MEKRREAVWIKKTRTNCKPVDKGLTADLETQKLTVKMMVNTKGNHEVVGVAIPVKLDFVKHYEKHNDNHDIMINETLTENY